MTGAGIVATFTRAGLITMAISLVTYGGLVYFKRGSWGREHARLVALAVVDTLVAISIVLTVSTGMDDALAEVAPPRSDIRV